MKNYARLLWKSAALLGGIALLVGNAGVVRAQVQTRYPMDGRGSLTAGVFLPSGALTDAFHGEGGLAASFSLLPRLPSPSRPFVSGFYYEAAEVSRDATPPGRKSDSITDAYAIQGGGVEGRFYLMQGMPFRAYVGGGTGIYYLRRKLVYCQDEFFETLFSRNLLSGDARFTAGFRAAAGLQVGRYVVAEARYMDAGVLDDVRFRGYTVSLGARF